MVLLGIPPQVCTGLTLTAGLAVFCSRSLVSVIILESSGCADHSSATTPTTCGPAIDVPEKLA